MKKVFSILALSMLPTLALATGNHSGGHDAPAHGMPGHANTMMPNTATPLGIPGDRAKVSRSIELTMDDTMRFTPGEIQVSTGDTIRFVIRNMGKIPHEMVIGSIADMKVHAAEMQQTPRMSHAERNMITLAPGKTGELVWQFNQAGIVDFACLIPGHMEAGMVGKVKVS